MKPVSFREFSFLAYECAYIGSLLAYLLRFGLRTKQQQSEVIFYRSVAGSWPGLPYIISTFLGNEFRLVVLVSRHFAF